MIYRSEIDGLRAVAVVPVVFFHAGLSVFSGGFVGVDVFFVISGYLITTLILEDLSEGRFSLWEFYERRMRRILPALFVVMAACIPFAWAWMQVDAYWNFSQSLVAVSVFISNVVFWRQNNYFGPGAEINPLLHTWSLAIEEQYYVVFPLFLMAVWGWRRHKALALVVILAFAGFLLCVWGARNMPNGNFYLTPFRAWELLAGSICAFATFRRPKRSSGALSLLGLALLLYAIFTFGEDTPFPSAYTLIPVLGTAMIIVFADRATLVGRLLSIRGFVGIGLISYSFYLWHQPLFAFARIRNVFSPPLPFMVFLAIFAACLAFLTWRYVERPFRRRGVFGACQQRTVFLATVAGIGVFTVIGGYGLITGGHATGFGWNFTEQQRATLSNIQQMRWTHRNKGNSQFDNGDCIFDTRYVAAEHLERISDCHTRYGSGVLVLGDSHATDIYGALSSNAGDVKFLVGLTRGGCRLHSPGPGCVYDGLPGYIAQNPDHFGKVIYQQAGFYLLEDDAGHTASRARLRVPLSQVMPPFVPKSDDVAYVAEYLRSLTDMVEVIWLGPRLAPHIPLEYFLYNGCDVDINPREGQHEMYQSLDSEIARQLAGTSIRYVSLVELLPFDLGSCGDLYWSDSDHFSQSGEKAFGKKLSVLMEAEVD